MNWKVLKTEDDYNAASIRLMEIFQAGPTLSKEMTIGFTNLKKFNFIVTY